ncbi:metal dependent phophohydrolase [Desulfobulbus propionicus DSM 2032]|uniref:Metal dependent phophohydrolase n=1 Tax=Desulfobulbus propionicus (strain ATCC 33891 / DSM 2032 / VKM B-1956 / 1pr3) TaxID=577650 RepID=A0A7U3YKF6_DESPD|nr:metal dependent phophohydrolase [Desulfobulbus propionicus DSM 2032]
MLPLPAVQTNPVLPSLADCIQLMDQYGMLGNIRHHSLVVARLAEQLQAGLAAVAPDRPQADRHLVISGALLHDIAKTPCLGSDRDHAKAGAEICRQHGYPEIAAIVEQHVLLWDYDPLRYRNGHFTAREIVYYADKRVRHNVVVNLDERLEYILEHYGKNNPNRRELIRENFNKCLTLEQHLFHWLPFGPEELGRF